MSYAGSLKIHDADAHIFESSDWLMRYADPRLRFSLRPLDLHGKDELIERATARETGTEGVDERLLAGKNWDALGASNPDNRKRALDSLGYHSQLVFSTYSHLSF